MNRQPGEAYARAVLVSECLGFEVRPNWREDLPELERVALLITKLGERLERATEAKAEVTAPEPEPVPVPPLTFADRLWEAEAPAVTPAQQGTGERRSNAPDAERPHHEVSLWKPGDPIFEEWEAALKGLECEGTALELLEKKWRKAFKVSLQQQVLDWLVAPASERQYREPLSPKQVKAWRSMCYREQFSRYERIRRSQDMSVRAA